MTITFEPFDHTPTSLRVLVSPGAGRLRYLPAKRFAGGRELVEAGQAVARILQGSGELILRAPVGGVVSSIIGIEGEPLVAGQAVLAIEPEAVTEPGAP